MNVFTRNSSSFGSLHPFCCQFVCGLCFGWLIFLLLTKQPQQSRYTCSHFPKVSQRQCIPVSSFQCSSCSLLPVFCFILNCISPLLTDAFCQFSFSNGFAGKSKWSLTLITVFTAPTTTSMQKNLPKSVCTEQQVKLTEPEPVPVQGYWAVLAYTVMEETR